MTNYFELQRIIDEAENIVFFGGAGVSTESGIPDFRGNGGLYTEDDENSVQPETILSAEFFRRYPKEFYDYYRSHIIYPYAKPNDAHYALARFEKEGKLSAVITQNIDGLHQEAGSVNVIELHGSAHRNYCVECGKQYGIDAIVNSVGVPRCSCGGIIRPDIVLYGEGLDGSALNDAEKAISCADVLIVGGTSLTVQPAASLIGYYEGEHLIIINSTPTPYDGLAELVIREPNGEVLADISYSEEPMNFYFAPKDDSDEDNTIGNIDLATVFENESKPNESSGKNEMDYLECAVKILFQAGFLTSTLLQRFLYIGYGRAMRILNLLENFGIIALAGHSKRTPLVGFDEAMKILKQSPYKILDENNNFAEINHTHMGGDGNESNETRDKTPMEYLQDAVVVLFRHGSLSTALLQRTMFVGYKRASNIMERLKNLGIIALTSYNKHTPLVGFDEAMEILKNSGDEDLEN